MPKYSELLLDPRWQKKRLKILERDSFTCQDCFDNEATLHIHHCKYGDTPWDVEDKFLLTLCWKCHQEREDANKRFKESYSNIQAIAGDENIFLITEIIDEIGSNFSPGALIKILNYIKDLKGVYHG